MKQSSIYLNNNNDADDIDSILKQLEDKNNKKKNASKLPYLNTKDKFYQKKVDQNPLRESKTQLKHG